MARKSPHRRVIDLLTGTEAHPAYLALIERILAGRGEISEADWQAAVHTHAEMVVHQLSGAEALGNAATFLTWPQGGPGLHAGAAAIARTDNLFAYPEGAPQVCVRLGSIHSVKGEMVIPARTISDDGYGQRGLEVPDIGPACLERLTADTVFRAKRSVRNGEVSYWTGNNLFSPWNGAPAHFDLCD